MTLSKVSWLEVGFLKVKEASQSPKFGLPFSRVFLEFLVTVTPPQVCLPETKQTAEGTFHHGSSGKARNLLDLFIDLAA